MDILVDGGNGRTDGKKEGLNGMEWRGMEGGWNGMEWNGGGMDLRRKEDLEEAGPCRV